MHCKVMKLSFQKGRGSKCKEDTKTDTVPPTSSPFKASKLTGSQSHNEKILRVLGFGFGWATRCVWASLRLIQTVWASWIQSVGCKIYKGMLRYHIFTASHWVKKCPGTIISSNIVLLQLWNISQGMDEWENGKPTREQPWPNLSQTKAAVCGCAAAVTP